MANVIEFVLKGKDKTGAAFGGAGSGLLKLTGVVAGLAGAAGLGALGKSFIDAASTTENLKIRMNAMLGSVSEGNKLFKQMSEFAGEVPFEYEEIMGAATQLSGIVKGGADEVAQFMPMIADLAAVSGLTIEETTGQVVRMFSAGAGAADLFRERGVNAMLGFEAGVAVSADETKRRLIEAFEDPQSKFAGASKELADTWDGILSMMSDTWFQFRDAVMASGLFELIKKGAKNVLEFMRKASSFILDNMHEWATNMMFFFNVATQVFTGIKNLILSAFSKEGFQNLVDNFKIAMGSMVDTAFKLIPIMGSILVETFISAFEIIHELAGVAFEQLFDLFTGQNVARSLADVIFEGIPARLEENKERFSIMFDDLGVVWAEKSAELSDGMVGLLDLNLELARAQAEATVAEVGALAEVVGATQDMMKKDTETFLNFLDAALKKVIKQESTMIKQFAKDLGNVMKTTIDKISNSIAELIVDGGNLMDTFKAIAKNVLKQVIASYVKMQLERLILNAVSTTSARTEARVEGAKAVALTGANMFSTMAAAPYPVNLSAPAVAGAYQAQSAALLAAGLAGQAHDGLDFVPREGTFLLDKGERVLSPSQNRDLTDFLGGSGEGGGGSVVIENLTIEAFPGITDINGLSGLTDEDFDNLVVDKFIPALNRASRIGVRQVDLERERDV